MAQYNPYAGPILGNEWVPIREETISIPPYSPNQAYGQHLELNSAYSLNELRWHVPGYPSGLIRTPIVGEVYPAGTEDLTGPIKRILVPASSVSTTGSDVTIVGGTGQAGLFNPSDFNNVRVNMSNSYVTDPAFQVFFAGSTYATLLAGKRILGINVLYAMTSNMSLQSAEEQGAGDGSIIMYLQSSVDRVPLAIGDWDHIENNTLPFDTEPALLQIPVVNYYRIPLGLANPFWNSGTQAFTDFAPWIPADLSRFEVSGSNRLGITVLYTDPSAPTAGFGINSDWEYMALEVFYCEENRSAVGINIPATDLALASWRTANNVNRIVLRDPITKAATPSVGPAAVTTLIYTAEVYPELAIIASPNVDVESLRQLYPIPSIAGTAVRMPFPYDPSVEGKVFEAEESDILPHLTLHTTTAVVPESHAYGRQAKAEVFGTITAEQEIQDSFGGVARSYPQARFYARKFGDTTVPLSLTRSSASTQVVTITPAEHDALPEIIDGWKEVTLRFDSAPSMGTGTQPNWIWSATGANAGSRWEILGAAAPALSGSPGNNFTLSLQQLGAATYGSPTSGAQTELDWVPGISPMVTTTTADPSSDATVLFSIDPSTPTEFTVSPLSQALAVTDPNCPVDPGCIPSELFYNRLSWTRYLGAAFDDFDRTVVSGGWGSATSGQAWTVSASTGIASVNGSYGVHTFPAAASGTITSSVDVGTPDQQIQFDFNLSVLDTATAMDVAILGRMTDDNNFYRYQVLVSTAGVIQTRLSKTVASVTTTLVNLETHPNLYFNADAWFTVKMQVSGSTISGKLWARDSPEPDVWSAYAIDTSHTTGNRVGLRSNDNSAAGVALVNYFDNFVAQPAAFGALEIQRYDPVDGEFNTIMLSTNAAITGFNDYEARVGQQSVYRTRARNVYDFAGQWSSQVTGTVASPGVSGGDTALTLFTSNFRQDGSVNLGYSASWDSNPVEEFSWVEGEQVTFQSMYRKNFPTAFHPLERGGEAFSRNILVNAAGVPATVTQNGFGDLREMAWDSVPYVCVRDELGNRWYSTVLVPQGARRRMRAAGHLETAQVRVVEVTDTPYPVDP